MSYEDLALPENAPLPGFYYHYKHDPAKGDYDFAYELLGTGIYTEDDRKDEDRLFAVYRPLYPSYAYTHGQLFDVRPLRMFMEPVIIDGKQMPRFTRIVDGSLLDRLMKRRDEMYFL